MPDEGSLGSAYASVGLERAGFDKALTSTHSAMVGWNKKIMKLASITIGVVGVASLIKALNKATEASIKFDTALRNVWTLTDETWQSMQQLGESVTDLSVRFGSTGEQGLQALYQIYSAGFKGADGLRVLDQALEASIAGISDVFTTATALTKVLNAWGKSTEEVEDVSDALFKTIELGVVTMDLLAGGIGKMISLAGPLGISINETFAAFAALTKTMDSAQAVGTALQAVFTMLLQPTDDLRDVMRDLGHETGRQMIETLGFADTLVVLNEAIMNAGSQTEDMVTNVRALRAVLPLTTSLSEIFADNIDQLAGKAGATADAFDKQKGKAFEMAMAQAELDEATRNLGDALDDLIDLKIELKYFFTDLVTWIGAAWEKMSDLRDIFWNWYYDVNRPGAVVQPGEHFPQPGQRVGYTGGLTREQMAEQEAKNLLEDLPRMGRESYEAFMIEIEKWRASLQEGAVVIDALTAAWQALLGEITDENVDKFWEELKKAHPDMADFIGSLKEFAKQAEGSEDVLLALHGALQEEYDKTTALIEAYEDLDLPLGDLEERAAILAEILGIEVEPALKSFADRLNEVARSGMGAGISQLLLDAQAQLLTALQGGTAENPATWADIQSAIMDIAGLGASVDQTKDYLERVITGDFAPNVKAAAQELYDELSTTGQLLGKTFEEIAAEAKRAQAEQERAAAAAQREAERLAREAQQRAIENQRAYEEAVVRAMVGAFEAGDLAGIIQGLRNLADEDMALALRLKGEVYVGIGDFIEGLALMGQETEDAADLFEQLKISLSDLKDQSVTTSEKMAQAAQNIAQVTQAALSAVGADPLLSSMVGHVFGAAESALANPIKPLGILLGAIGLIGDVIGGFREAEERRAEEEQTELERLKESFRETVKWAWDLAGSFADLVKQTELYRVVQGFVNDVLGDFFNILEPLKVMFAAILEVTTEQVVQTQRIIQAQARLFNLNVPYGWKALNRIRYDVSTPGEPPIYGEEPTSPFDQLEEDAETVSAIMLAFGDEIEMVKLKFIDLRERFEEIWGKLWPSLVSAALGTIDIFENILIRVGDHIEGLIPTFTAFISEFGVVLSTAMRGLEPVLHTAIDAVAYFANWFTNFLGPELRGFFNQFGSWWRTEMDPFLQAEVFPRLQGVLEDVWGWFRQLWDTVSPHLIPLFERLGDVFDKFWEAVSPMINTLLDFINEHWDVIEDFLVNQFEQWLNTLGDRLQDLIDLLEMVTGLGQWAGIPGYQHGGIVPGPIGAPQLAVVHGGEHVLPAGGTAGAAAIGPFHIHVDVDGEEMAHVVIKELRRRAGGLSPIPGVA